MTVSSQVRSLDDTETRTDEDAVRLADLLTDGRLPAACPSRVVLDHVTSKWGVLLLLALSEGDLRWGELRRTVEGISEKMLAQTLRTLEADGLVDRTVTATVPPRVDYALTPLGRELADHLLPLMGWIAEHADAIVAGRVVRATHPAHLAAELSRR